MRKTRREISATGWSTTLRSWRCWLISIEASSTTTSRTIFTSATRRLYSTTSRSTTASKVKTFLKDYPWPSTSAKAPRTTNTPDSLTTTRGGQKWCSRRLRRKMKIANLERRRWGTFGLWNRERTVTRGRGSLLSTRFTNLIQYWGRDEQGAIIKRTKERI